MLLGPDGTLSEEAKLIEPNAMEQMKHDDRQELQKYVKEAVSTTISKRKARKCLNDTLWVQGGRKHIVKVSDQAQIRRRGMQLVAGSS